MGYSNVLRVSTDVETTFGVDQVETYRDQPVIEGTYQPRNVQVHHQDMTVVQRLHQRNRPVLGSKFGSGFSASYILSGLAAGLKGSVSYSAPQTSLLEILKAAYGGVRGAAGSLIDDSSGGGVTTTQSLPMTTGEGPRFVVGGGLMVSGVFREISTQSNDRVGLTMALPAAPANGVVVYNAVTVYPDEDGVGGDGNSLCCRVLGYDAQDQWIYRGCVPQITSIRSEIDQPLTVDIDMMAATWTRTTGETLGTATIVDGGELPPVAGRIWVGADDSSTIGALECHRFNFVPGLSAVPTRTFGTATVPSVQTIQRFRQHRQQATLSLGLRMHARDDWETWMDLYATRPQLKIILQFGNTPIDGGAGTGVVVLSMPGAVFSAAPQRVEEDNEVSINLEFMAREDRASSGTTDITAASTRIHLL